jgi:hypothetical protein
MKTTAGSLVSTGDLLAGIVPEETVSPEPPAKLSKRMGKRLDNIERVRLSREKEEQQIGYLAKPFLLCGLPFKPVKNASLYERKNGNETLTITANPKHGLPFGADIQVLIWVSTLAVLQKVDGKIPRVIEFESAAEMLKAFGLPLDGRTYQRMQQRFLRVFYSTFFYGREGQRTKLYSFRFFDDMDLWFTKDLQSSTLPGDDFTNNRIKLSEAFAEDLERHAPPIDLEMVKLWSDKPGQLFFALWLTYRCFTAKGRVTIPMMGSGSVYEQCGVDGYDDPENGMRNFRKKVTKWLQGVKAAWPECPVTLIPTPHGGSLVIEHKALAIHQRKQKI